MDTKIIDPSIPQQAPTIAEMRVIVAEMHERHSTYVEGARAALGIFADHLESTWLPHRYRLAVAYYEANRASFMRPGLRLPADGEARFKRLLPEVGREATTVFQQGIEGLNLRGWLDLAEWFLAPTEQHSSPQLWSLGRGPAEASRRLLAGAGFPRAPELDGHVNILDLGTWPPGCADVMVERSLAEYGLPGTTILTKTQAEQPWLRAWKQLRAAAGPLTTWDLYLGRRGLLEPEDIALAWATSR